MEQIYQNVQDQCTHAPANDDQEPCCGIVKLAGGRNWLELGLRCRRCGLVLERQRLPARVECVSD